MIKRSMKKTLSTLAITLSSTLIDLTGRHLCSTASTKGSLSKKRKKKTDPRDKDKLKLEHSQDYG